VVQELGSRSGADSGVLQHALQGRLCSHHTGTLFRSPLRTHGCVGATRGIASTINTAPMVQYHLCVLALLTAAVLQLCLKGRPCVASCMLMCCAVLCCCQVLAEFKGRLSFTCVEMRDCEHPPEGRCSPQGLLQQVCTTGFAACPSRSWGHGQVVDVCRAHNRSPEMLRFQLYNSFNCIMVCHCMLDVIVASRHDDFESSGEDLPCLC